MQGRADDLSWLVMELILKAKDLRPEFQYLNLRLQLEMQRLWNWGDISGFLSYLGGKEDALDSSLTGLNRHVILEIVLHIQTLLTEFVKTKGRYQEFAAVSSDPDLVQRIPGSKDRVRNILRALEITHQLPKRIRWAMWDQDKFKGLSDRLKEMNDCLIDLADNSMKTQIMNMTKETNINLLGLHSKVDDLGQLVKALTRTGTQLGSTFETRIRVSYGLQHTQNDKEEEMRKDLLDLTKFKSLLQTTESRELSSEQLSGLELDRKEIKINSTSSTSAEGIRTKALYRGEEVWIEWKRYTPFTHSSTRPDPRILSRVQKLAALLRTDPKPVGFRVPRCLGYFDEIDHDAEGQDPEDFSHFGYVFAIPDGLQSTTPVTLFEILQQPSMPSLTDRLSIAKEISNSVYSLHSVGWLHKGLRSQNIIFFPSRDGSIDFAKPYLTGFEYARPDISGEMTEVLPGNPEFDIYRHPDILSAASSGGYKCSYDIYSVGIILLEIAGWKIVADMLDPEKKRRIVLSKVKIRLLTEGKYLEMVSASAGSLFKEAVLCCLQGAVGLGVGEEEDEMGERVSAKVDRGFHELVVKRLEGIRC